jgi:hypothetical protein
MLSRQYWNAPARVVVRVARDACTSASKRVGELGQQRRET